MTAGRILIVEDEEDFRDLLEKSLVPAGFELSFAEDGREGLEAFARTTPDLVILDVNLPFKDGFEVCREIRSASGRPRTPILMLTIRHQASEVVRGLELGADDYMAKPFDPDELVARVRMLLRLRERRNA